MGNATWKDIVNAVSTNRARKHAKDIEDLTSAYYAFLNGLLQRVAESKEIVTPCDQFSFCFHEALLDETISAILDMGFEYDAEKLKAFGDPAKIKL